MDASKNNSQYKIQVICDSMVYTKKSIDYLSGLYYLIFWKGYLEEKNIWEPTIAIKHLRKLISLFYKDSSNKITTILKAIDIILLMVRLTIKPATKLTVKLTALK